MNLPSLLKIDTRLLPQSATNMKPYKSVVRLYGLLRQPLSDPREANLLT